MGKYNGQDATVWMVAAKDHTYEGRSVAEGDTYLAHEELVETLGICFGDKRDTAPLEARRPEVMLTQAPAVLPEPVTPAASPPDDPAPTDAPWPTPSATSAKARRSHHKPKPEPAPETQP